MPPLNNNILRNSTLYATLDTFMLPYEPFMLPCVRWSSILYQPYQLGKLYLINCKLLRQGTLYATLDTLYATLDTLYATLC